MPVGQQTNNASTGKFSLGWAYVWMANDVQRVEPSARSFDWVRTGLDGTYLVDFHWQGPEGVPAHQQAGSAGRGAHGQTNMRAVSAKCELKGSSRLELWKRSFLSSVTVVSTALSVPLKPVVSEFQLHLVSLGVDKRADNTESPG